ncbi:1,4-alpha-glucan branching protein GlgB [Actinacidiphila paucisporea]|uniref:1,4-alpha-glucan branching enzyme GlgB n=1 Tax=Actinacidiphila paucisporea TaxID=310782 RepID=A0A1M7QKV5_9ACTN|nr:1,4-alpha-glucan branching protein GlgB [Actinacidiphila paucisporea]SHN31968.1 1,4-alpha-glucan branching enzyme [Actinacidiphila paucisporea]
MTHEPTARDGALPEATARGYTAATPHPAASGSAPRPPAAAEGALQGRGELRDQPTTGRRSGDDSNSPTGPVTTRATAEAERAVPRAPEGRTPQPNSTPAGEGRAPERNGTPAGAEADREGTLAAEDRRRLLAGEHHDPHALLGAHPESKGIRIRALRPYATGVAVVTANGDRVETAPEGDGLFSVLLPGTEVPGYRLAVAYEGADEILTEDPYRFLPSLGELDLHLIGEGRHEQLWKALGSEPMTHAGVAGTRFAVWAPNARGVRLAADFTFWDGTSLPMRSLGSTGVWELFVPGVGPGTAYKYDIARPDGSHGMKADPMARATEVPPATASVVTESAYEWDDAEWMARRADTPVHRAPFSVYEVHLPSWRPGLSYRELAEQLPAYVKDLGFTHVELMPVAGHPFSGSWGYQVTSYYAPMPRQGSPDDFRYLVDALHRAGIGVIMDWVPAHFPKDEWALARFDGEPLYEPADPRRAEHPDWGTLEFDFGRTEVRNFLVANAVYWCEDFHIDGLRVDAVASMLYLDYSREGGDWLPNIHGGRENLDAVAFLQEMNATVYRRCPGVITIAEESTAWDGVTRATHHVGHTGFGGLGFGLKWNMGWMHDSLGYIGHEPVHRKYHHDEMTFSMVYAYSENYVLPISHDEVVHGKGSLVSKVPGDWWQQRATLRAYLGFMWSHPGKQLLFMGQEFAQGAEWSHESGPDWWLVDPEYSAAGDHRGVRDLVRELNTVYTATPALWQSDTDPAGFEWIEGGAAEDNVFAFLRFDAAGEPLLCVSNFSPVVRDGYRLGSPAAVWTPVLNTDELRFGGSGVALPDQIKTEASPWHGRPHSVTLALPPLSTVWLRPETPGR